MLLASISATLACACLPWRTFRWDLKLRSNSSHPVAKNRFEWVGRFVIAPSIYMELSFRKIPIGVRTIE
jgi:hypothetical protein